MNLLILIIVIAGLFLTLLFIFSQNRKNDGYNRIEKNYNKNENNKSTISKTPNSQEPTRYKSINSYKKNWVQRLFSSSNKTRPNRPTYIPFDAQAIEWCANFLTINKEELIDILVNTSAHYAEFCIKKRSGGFRTISAPNAKLLNIQRTIYHRVLLPVNIHPAATGFRQGISIVNNASVHLNKKNIFKTDIKDFFGSIRKDTIIKAFERIGYPTTISTVLAALCCLKSRLPQGAPTSPILSNIVCYEMDNKLSIVATKLGLSYTRYADDLTFSGDAIDPMSILQQINETINEEGLKLNRKKTQYLAANKRKIITGISISSGEKLTIPKAKKRELRKIIYFIRTKGLDEHQKHIKSKDPVYLKRTIGYLNFWHAVEPNNKYVMDSLQLLTDLKKSIDKN